MNLSITNLTAMGASNDNATKFIQPFNDIIIKYSINTQLRISHFLSQIFHESTNLTTLHENLNYGKDGLLKTFPKYFPTPDIADQYAKQPQKIANKVYENRLGNGAESTNDGWMYCGRGLLQTTGKINYSNLSKALGVNFVLHPEYLEQPQYASLSAGFFWNSKNLNHFADLDDVIGVTKLINGGTNGLEARKILLEKAKKIFSI